MSQGLEETFLIARLSFRLLSLLGLGWKWNLQLWRLLLYSILLLPGFIQVRHREELKSSAKVLAVLAS